MFFKKFLKRSQPVQAKAVEADATRIEQPVNAAGTGLIERRSFPRILPTPEVLERDWSTWVDVTEKKSNDK
jgi:hypothetical protein